MDDLCFEDMDARPRGPKMSSKFDYPKLRAFNPPVGDSTSDVAKRMCAAAPLVFDSERVEVGNVLSSRFIQFQFHSVSLARLKRRGAS